MNGVALRHGERLTGQVLAAGVRAELRSTHKCSAVQPWLLKTMGRCVAHSDASRQRKGDDPGFTMLFVLSSVAPYLMRFWPRGVEAKPVDFIVSGGQVLMFPASMVHACIAGIGEQRTVMNILFTFLKKN